MSAAQTEIRGPTLEESSSSLITAGRKDRPDYIDDEIHLPEIKTTRSSSSILRAVQSYSVLSSRAYSPPDAQSTLLVRTRRQAFQYQALPTLSTIRILVLSPAAYYDSELHCEIVLEDLDNLRTTYDAISYAWGEPAFISDLLISGQVRHITPTLDAALRRLRSPDNLRYLWADAVCINQDDAREKSSQVSMMARIYHNARIICVHLGSMPSDSEKAFDFFRSLVVHREEGSRFDSTINDTLINEVALEVFGSSDLRPVYRFFRLPWFQRRWTFQELVHQNHDWIPIFFYGISSLPWSHLSLCFEILGNSLLSNHPKVRNALECLRIGDYLSRLLRSNAAESGRRTPSMLGLLNTCHSLSCNDPRDRIYALRACGGNVESSFFARPWSNSIPIMVNYELPVKHIYQDFATKHIMQYRNLDILHSAGAFKLLDSSKNIDLPSWIPVWYAPRRFRPLLHTIRYMSGIVTDDKSEDLPTIVPDGPKLLCRGSVIDVVIDTAVATTTEPEAAYIFDHLRSWCQPLYRRGLLSGSPEAMVRTQSSFESFSKCVTADFAWLSWDAGLVESNDQDELGAEAAFTSDEEVTEFTHAKKAARADGYAIFYRIANLLPKGVEFSDLDPSCQFYARQVCQVMAGRTIFITEKAMIGVGPSDTMVGDEVAVLATGRTPFILRRDVTDIDTHQPGAGDSDKFRLIGDAYVDGLMTPGTLDKYQDEIQEICII